MRARANQQQLKADFEAYLDGFSPNVQDILTNFEFRNIIPRLSKADALGTMIAKFLDPEINLSPNPVLNGDGSVKHPGMDNHSMGTVFEELVRKFNEENNEEAGEHWTPRDAVKLMANLIFLPVAKAIESGSYLIYDGALGTGGMLTVAEETLKDLAAKGASRSSPTSTARRSTPRPTPSARRTCCSKARARTPTTSSAGPNGPRSRTMPSRPASSTSCSRIRPTARAGKRPRRRWAARTACATRASRSCTTTRNSPSSPAPAMGSLLFLANMVSKMNDKTKLGSRIAEVHNGSSLFTGDAGQGESNIRRWIIENDWLEAIVALPLNMFYNTGIATYIWVLSNRKAKPRQGKVQLIDATQWFKPLRKNLGKKNCELSADDIRRICDTFTAFQETEQSKIFPNDAFGYRKITVERPLRLHSQITPKAIESLRFASGDEGIRSELYDRFGDKLFTDFAKIRADVAKGSERLGPRTTSEDEARKATSDRQEGPAREEEKEAARSQDLGTRRQARRGCHGIAAGTRRRGVRGSQPFPRQGRGRTQEARSKLTGPEMKVFRRAVSWRVETAPPVIAKVHKAGKARADPLYGRYEARRATRSSSSNTNPTPTCATPSKCRCWKKAVEAFLRREVLPYTPGRLDRRSDQDRLRDQLHPPLLQAAAAAHAGRNPRRYPGRGKGGRRPPR